MKLCFRDDVNVTVLCSPDEFYSKSTLAHIPSQEDIPER